jgi:hypothetical protein
MSTKAHTTDTLHLQPGPLVGERLLAIWPRLRPFVAEAIEQQDEDVRQLLLAILSADASRLTFQVAGLKVVASLADRPFCAVPLVALTERPHREAH